MSLESVSALKDVIENLYPNKLLNFLLIDESWSLQVWAVIIHLLLKVII